MDLQCQNCLFKAYSNQGNARVLFLTNKESLIIGATVQVKGTSNGAVTDLDGRFSLSNIPPGSIIVIS